MRNKYSKEFEQEMIKLAPTNELTRLWWVARQKYAYFITKEQLRQYLSKRQIRYKDYNSNKAQEMGNKIPIGTEYVKPDGMVLVKVKPNKWKYKQRLIYEQYYNVELKEDEYIIFLDQDRTNFDISNLKLVSRKESAVMSNQKLFSKNPFATETGIKIAQLLNKLSDLKEGKTK